MKQILFLALMSINALSFGQKSYDPVDSIPEQDLMIIEPIEDIDNVKTELIFRLELHKSVIDSTIFFMYEFDTPYNCSENLYFITKQYADYFEMKLKELEKSKIKNQNPKRT